jgi:hypothetical protein
MYSIFRRQKKFFTIKVRPEGSTLFADVRKFLKAENLKPAGVCQNWTVPVHEIMEAAKLANQFMTGPDKQVVGVSQYDLGPQLQKIFRSHSLDRGLGTNRHENRCLYGAMKGLYFSSPGIAL